MGVGSLKKVKENIEGKQIIATGSSYYSQVLGDKRKEVIKEKVRGIWENHETF